MLKVSPSRSRAGWDSSFESQRFCELHSIAFLLSMLCSCSSVFDLSKCLYCHVQLVLYFQIICAWSVQLLSCLSSLGTVREKRVLLQTAVCVLLTSFNASYSERQLIGWVSLPDTLLKRKAFLSSVPVEGEHWRPLPLELMQGRLDCCCLCCCCAEPGRR